MVIGIIAEYNPFHSGHLYHINETRRLLDPEAAIVVLMSGNAVQRGDFPIMTKYARARAAVLAGVDLVFELPAPQSCACAERFAGNGVEMLTRLGIVTHISFGSETGDIASLEKLAGFIPDAYPKDRALASALPEMQPEHAGLYMPNNILGIEYLKAIHRLGSHLIPVTVQRKGSLHDDCVASASAYRRRLIAGECGGLPAEELVRAEVDAGRAPIDISIMEKAVLSRLRGLTREQLELLPENSGGFHNRLYSAIHESASLPELYSNIKSKRFTMARVRRAVLCVFLGITEERALAKPPLRLLAAGKRGTALLSDIKEPIISKPAAHKDALHFESSVTDQLALAMPAAQPCGMEWTNGVGIL